MDFVLDWFKKNLNIEEVGDDSKDILMAAAPMHSRLYIPSDEVYANYVKIYPLLLENFKKQGCLTSTKSFYLNVLKISLDDRDYFNEKGELLPKVDEEAVEFTKELIASACPLLSKQAFFEKSIQDILSAVDRPVLNLFVYLTLKGKTPYSSRGYVSNGGEAINFNGLSYPFGVTWQEAGVAYRAALVKETVKFYQRDTKYNWNLLNEHEVSQLGVSSEEIIMPTRRQRQYIDISSGEAVQSLLEVCEAVHHSLKLPFHHTDEWNNYFRKK